MHTCPRGREPKMFTSPDVGGSTPDTALNNVLFPAPFGPTTATRSPHEGGNLYLQVRNVRYSESSGVGHPGWVDWFDGQCVDTYSFSLTPSPAHF